MKRTDFNFYLPEELIAQQPATNRRDSRLLHLDASGTCHDKVFSDVLDLCKPGDLLVFNDTRVVPARLLGKKDTGGQVEVLVERIWDTERFYAQVRSSKALRPGRTLVLEGSVQLEVISRQEDLYELKLLNTEDSVLDMLEKAGRIPLPPYIDRVPDKDDRERYQTVYARNPGAVAAPTAGLHFDEALIEQLKDKELNMAWLTLHVGAGTFQPMRTDNLDEHKMHHEYIDVDDSVVQKILATRKRGGRVIAVGTTVVRALESAAFDGMLKPVQGETNIFITPGYHFNVIDALITNFHLPESTLLMLVSAFAGMQPVLDAYHHAVEHKYRFFSYGDAMFIEANPDEF